VFLEVAISGGDHARVDVDQAVSAYARELEVLEHMEELGLEGERQLGDLVEIDRALVRVLELAWLAPERAGEGAFLVAEELGFEQLGRNCGAVDFDERTVTARRCGMNGPGDKILPHAALATDQHGRISVCDVLDSRPDRPHPSASVEEWGRAGVELPQSLLSHVWAVMSHLRCLLLVLTNTLCRWRAADVRRRSDDGASGRRAPRPP